MLFENKGIFGPDVSFYQADPRKRQFIDYQKMKEWRNEDGDGVSFVIIKASQKDYFDAAFAVNRSAARAAGIPRAFYHFLDYRLDGKAQAQFYWNLIKDDPGEGPLIVDFEMGSGGFGRLWDFLVELQKLSKYPADRIWIYTGYYYWMDHGPTTQAEEMAFIPYRLWLAAYTAIENAHTVKVPRPWLTSTMWQQGVTTVYGPNLGVLSLELDWNIFNGDRALWRRYWLSDYVPGPIDEDEEEEGDDEVLTYRVIWPNGVARRLGPSTSHGFVEPKYETLVTVLVQEDGIPDGNDPSNVNKKWVKFADGLYGASDYPNSAGVPASRMVKVVLPDPDPNPDAPTHRIDVYPDGKIAVDGGQPF